MNFLEEALHFWDNIDILNLQIKSNLQVTNPRQVDQPTSYVGDKR